jgi:hypothetical protein
MAFDHAKINEQLARLYKNGRFEVGLEVGSDPGLPHSEWIRIPKGFHRDWCARVVERPDNIAEYLRATGSQDAAAEFEYGQKEKGPRGAVGKKGWVTKGSVYVVSGKVWASIDGVKVEVDRFEQEPVTSELMAAFYTVNKGCVRDSEFSESQRLWVHAVRFWALVAGFVVSSKQTEYVTVDFPKELDPGSEQFCNFCVNQAENSLTASAARAATWRKSNHATGGPIATGFARRWLQKMGYWPTTGDRGARERATRVATNAFYVATHASGVHPVLALTAPADRNHWAKLNPGNGLILGIDAKDSANLRSIPNTQVAGGAMVADSVEVAKLMVDEGLTPLLNTGDKLPALMAAYRELEQGGIRCASYGRWFLDGHPRDIKAVDFNQKSSAFASLIGELAHVANKYYVGQSIAASASLKSAMEQLGTPVSADAWTQLGSRRSAMSGEQIIRVYDEVKGASATKDVVEILSDDETTAAAALAAYNARCREAAKAVGAANPMLIDEKAVLAKRAERVAAESGKGSGKQ